MHESNAKRVADFPAKERPDHLKNMPEDTHIVSGVLEGHATASLASEKATLSGKVVKLQRTASGGVEYQLAIFVSEPTPAPVLVVTDEDRAVKFFTDKGFPLATAKAQVAKFGAARVLAAAEKEKADAEKGLDAELEDVLAKKAKA